MNKALCKNFIYLSQKKTSSWERQHSAGTTRFIFDQLPVVPGWWNLRND